ncbi:MAG: 3-hydroxyacyl-ACP dehydratase [Chitinophagaceae bacterium]
MSYEQSIIDLIPQRHPFVMIDKLVFCDDVQARTTLTVKKENIFVQDGRLREPGLVENIAQTAAARMGYLCKAENKPVPVGFIGAVQNLSINQLPAVEEEITTEITIKNQVFDVTIITGKVECGGKELASCEMKIFISNKP